MKRTVINISAGAAMCMPVIASAQELIEVNTFFSSLLTLVNRTLIPLMFAVAILGFFYGVFKYLIVGGADESKREEGKKLMIWAVIGFVVMVSLYGIIGLVQSSFGITDNEFKGSLPTAPGTKAVE